MLLITDSGQEEISFYSKDPATILSNVENLLAILRTTLQEGTPVMIDTFSFSSIPGPTNNYKHALEVFLSDGTIRRQNNSIALGTLGGRNKVRVSIDYKSDITGEKFVNGTEEPRIMRAPPNSESDIILPWFSAKEDLLDKQRFRDEPPRMHLQGAETPVITLGRRVEQEYANLLNLQKFGADAIKFELPLIYTHHMNTLIFHEYYHHDSANENPFIKKVPGLAIQAFELNAIMLLLDKVRKPEGNRRLENLLTQDLIFSTSQFGIYKKAYHIIENTDIPITNGFSADVYCFVKFNNNDIYVLPTKRHLAVVEEALSPENVEKYFPGKP